MGGGEAMWMLESILKAGEQDRSKALRTEENGWIVDTIMAGDTDRWETGIKVDDREWVIVQQYDCEELAKLGHEKWVKLMREDPQRELRDVLFPQWLEKAGLKRED
jgi:hypothetical protein